MGAWIETRLRQVRPTFCHVAPFMGAWIETIHYCGSKKLPEVAPFMGAWIETGQLTAGNGACKMSSAGMESTGDIKAQNISLLSHKHSGVETGGGTTGGPTP